MQTVTRALLLIAVLTVIRPSTLLAQDARPALEAAARAIGAHALSSIQVSGHGSDYVVGQAYDGSSPWPRFNMPSFSMTIDYVTPAMRTETPGAQGEDPPRGGALQPLAGEQRLVQFVSGRFAWNQSGQNPTPAGAGGAVRGESPGVGLHTPTAVEERLLQIWLTPPGFIKAALANQAEARTEGIGGARKTVISFATPINLTLEGLLNEEHLLERVETWTGHPVLGDTMIEAVFLDYKDFGGVRFPTRITFREGGYPAFDLTVTAVTPNSAATIEVPASIKQAAPPAPPAVAAQEIADRIWLLPGGSQSLAVEFRDHPSCWTPPWTKRDRLP
jgi:hypothetical protein